MIRYYISLLLKQYILHHLLLYTSRIIVLASTSVCAVYWGECWNVSIPNLVVMSFSFTLASSPIRQHLLDSIGFHFSVIVECLKTTVLILHLWKLFIALALVPNTANWPSSVLNIEVILTSSATPDLYSNFLKSEQDGRKGWGCPNFGPYHYWNYLYY